MELLIKPLTLILEIALVIAVVKFIGWYDQQ